MARMAPDEALVAIDPGRDKCGLAVVDGQGALLAKEVVAAADLTEALRRLLGRHPGSRLVLGDRTGSRAIRERLAADFPEVAVGLVSEHRSTERALARWRETVPARGLHRLLPRSLRFPREPLDDFAAWILAEDYLSEAG